VKKIAALLAAFTACLGLGTLVVPAHADASKKGTDVYSETFHVLWHHNPSGSDPDHWVDIYGHVLGFTGNGQPLHVSDIRLTCGDTGNGLWGTGTNVDGNGLDWGAYQQTTNDYNILWAAPYGGNIAACGADDAVWSYPSGGDIDNAVRTVRIRYEFTTNYGPGMTNDHVKFVITFPWRTDGGTGGGGGGPSSPCVVDKSFGIGTFIPTTVAGVDFDCWGVRTNI
jgi:hypothetical protein